MIVNVGLDDGLHVLIDTESHGYDGPDVLDDLCARARALFRDAMTDARALETE